MPDKLPNGWVKTTLGDVKVPSRARALPSEAPKLPYVGMEHVEARTMKLLGRGKASGLKSSSVKFNTGDVLYGKMRPYLNKVWLAEFDGLCSAEFLVFPKTEGLNSRLFAYRLNSQDFVNFANRQVSGDRPRVDFEKLAKFCYLLAPSREQERIVAKLDAMLSRLAAGEAAARRALERLKRYRATVLHAAVTGELTRDWRKTHKPDETGAQLLKRLLQERQARWEEAEFKRLQAAGKTPKDDKWKKRYRKPSDPKIHQCSALPKKWIWVSFDQATLNFDGTRVPMKAPDRDRRSGRYPYYGASGIIDQIDDYLFDGDYLLIAEDGANLLSRSKPIAFPANGRFWVNNHAHVVRPVLCPREFIATYLNATDLKLFVTGTAQPKLNQANLNRIPVPLPPLDEQAEIVLEVERRIAAAERLATTLNRQLERAHVTRQSLLHEAFGGNLVPQDPNDEPASILLERIRAARAAEKVAQKQVKRVRAKPIPEQKKETTVMNQYVPTTDDLQKAWQKIGKKPDAKKLFEVAGFALEQVVSFYGLLRTSSAIVELFKAASKGGKAPPKVAAIQPKQVKQKPGRFRLVSLWLEDFKNLKNYTVNFNSAHGLDIVLGWNGTGKSNLFESLVIIFRDLHYWWEKNKWADEPMAGYHLVYEIENHVVEVKWNPKQMKRPDVTCAAIPKNKDAKPEFKPVKREDLPLPKFVFGYYSGPTNRMAEHFWPMKRDHYELLRSRENDDPETLAMLLEHRRFFCAETHHAKYVLLAFSYKEDPKIRKFLEDRLRIIGFESALFIIRKPRWAKGTSKDFWGATGIMRRVMEKLKRYAIAPMVLKQKVSDGYRLPSEEHYYFFLPDLKSLHEFAAEYADARSFFLALESTDFSELIYDVKIQVRVKAANNQNIPITFRELSEGEQQLLMVLGLMRFTKSHQSLILLDEPDTHLNPHWSVEYLKDLASVVSDDDDPSPEQQTSQLLMATHDPLVIASLLKDQVHLLKRDPDTLICRWEQATVNPKGLGFTGILTSEMFGFRSDLDPETLADLDNRVRLVAKETELTGKEKKSLDEIDKRLAEAGFSKAFSDPYYGAFVRAWGRRYAGQMAGKEVMTKKDTEEIDRIARKVLAEAVAEVEKETEAHAIH